MNRQWPKSEVEHVRLRMRQANVLAGILLASAWIPALGQDAAGEFSGTITLRSGETLQGTIKLAEFGVVYGSSIGTLHDGCGYIELNVAGNRTSTPARDIWAVQAEWRNEGTAETGEAANWAIARMVVTRRNGTQVIGEPTWRLCGGHRALRGQRRGLRQQ